MIGAKLMGCLGGSSFWRVVIADFGAFVQNTTYLSTMVANSRQMQGAIGLHSFLWAELTWQDTCVSMWCNGHLRNGFAQFGWLLVWVVFHIGLSKCLMLDWENQDFGEAWRITLERVGRLEIWFGEKDQTCTSEAREAILWHNSARPWFQEASLSEPVVELVSQTSLPLAKTSHLDSTQFVWTCLNPKRIGYNYMRYCSGSQQQLQGTLLVWSKIDWWSQHGGKVWVCIFAIPAKLVLLKKRKASTVVRINQVSHRSMGRRNLHVRKGVSQNL